MELRKPAAGRRQGFPVRVFLASQHNRSPAWLETAKALWQCNSANLKKRRSVSCPALPVGVIWSCGVRAQNDLWKYVESGISAH